MSWLKWFKLKGRAAAADAENVPSPKPEKPPPENKDDADPQQKLWHAESSSAMRSLITGMTEQNLTDLVVAIPFAAFPLNSLASAGGSLDKRSTLTVHFTFQLLQAGKHPQANRLLDKILDKMRAKLATGAREGGAVPQGQERAFESAFAAGDMGSATEILKQNRSTDFWRMDEVLKRELYDLAMELLKKDRNRESAILLDAVMLDYPHDVDAEFWRAAAYHNIFSSNKSDNEAKHNAKQAIGSFLHRAEGNQQYAQKCSDLRRIMSEQYGEPSAAKQKAPEPEVQDLTFSTSSPYLAAALFARYISEHGCACGGKWESQTGDVYQCGKCGARKIFRVYHTR